MTLCGGLAIGILIEATATQPEKDTAFKITAWIILSLLTLLPVLFSCVLRRFRGTLDQPLVRQKIGALYDNFNPMKPKVGTYAIVFLIRRSLFVALTFCLFRNPGI